MSQNMHDMPHISPAFRLSASRCREGEILLMFDRNIGLDIPEKTKKFIDASLINCTVSAAWFGMYYGLEPMDMATPAPSSGRYWNTQDDALPALEDLRRRARDGGFKTPLHVIFISTAQTLGMSKPAVDASATGYPQAVKREMAQLAAAMKNATFDIILCTGAKPVAAQPSALQAQPPLPVRDAGGSNRYFYEALEQALGAHIAAVSKKNNASATAAAARMASGVQKDITAMKPLRIVKK